MNKISRRNVLGLGLAVPVGLAGLRLGTTITHAEETMLRVATWGGSYRDSLDQNVASKLKSKGISVEFSLGNPEDNLAKLIAAQRQGQVPFDVMDSLPNLTGKMAEGGLIEALNYDTMPNVMAAPKVARAEYETVAYWSEDGIIYNAEKFREAGIEPPARYGDLANPKLKGRVAFPDIRNSQHWNAVVGLAYENGGNEANMDVAIDAVNDIAPSYFFSASTDLATRFGSGDIWAAAWHSGWAMRVRRSDVPVEFAYPYFGDRRGALWPVPQYIVKGTPHLAAAEAFIDTLFSPEVQYEHGKATGVVPANLEARARLGEDPLSNSFLLLSDEEINQAFQIDWSQFDQDKWREAWMRGIKR